jgi:CRP-like cAMP-binding protein
VSAKKKPSVGSLLRKLGRFAELSQAERKALEDAFPTATSLGAGVDLFNEGEQPKSCCLIVEGFACRYKRLADGRRQIMSFQFPGDICDLSSLYLGAIDHSIGTLTPAKVAAAPHDTVRRLIATFPPLGEAFLRDTLIDAAIFREWVVNVGQRSALERTAHLICEIYSRCAVVGLTNGDTVELPLTQAELADALGLSTVHVNRTVQELRAAGLITLRSRSLTVQDWDRLRQVAGFKTNYLHQLAA